MALYRDEVVRITLAQIRAQFAPRVFGRLSSVRLKHHGVVAEIEIVAGPGTGSIARRPWLRCPSCGRLVGVVAALDGGWGCRSCGRWRSRNRQRSGVDLATAAWSTVAATGSSPRHGQDAKPSKSIASSSP
jgi:ribosomal protein L37AE/L43A